MVKQVPPKREIAEFAARWRLTKLKSVVVEGVFDQNFFRILQDRRGFSAELDFFAIDTVDIPAKMVSDAGFDGTGCKQRVIAMAKALEQQFSDGFKFLIDRDFDNFLGRNYAASNVLITTPSALNLYCWSPDCFSFILTVFRANALKNQDAALELYSSINEVALRIAAVRIFTLRNNGVKIGSADFEKSLSMQGNSVVFDLFNYLRRCGVSPSACPKLMASIAEIWELELTDGELHMNDHDLVIVLLFAIRHFSGFPRTSVNADLIESSITAYGCHQAEIIERDLFAAMIQWSLN